MKQALLVPYTFVLMNWAAVVSLYCFLRRGNNVVNDVWTQLPPRPAAQNQAMASTGDQHSRAA